MKKITLTLFVILLLAAMSSQVMNSHLTAVEAREKNNNNSAVAEIKQKLDSKQYSEALSLISKSMRATSSDPEAQAPYIKLLADFNRDISGNMEKALMNYRRIVNIGLPGDHPLTKTVKEEIKRIKDLQLRNRQQDAEIRAFHGKVNRKRKSSEIEEDLEQLEAFINRNPDYYLLHEAYYLQALNYEALEKPGEVYENLIKAMELKPGIVFYLPVKFRARKARAADIRNKINGAVRAIFWILLLITMIVFYKSMPWQWLRIRHAALPVLLVSIWWLGFTLSHAAVGAVYENSRETLIVIQEGKDTEYRYAGPGSPGSDVVKPLFHYGIIGMAAIFIFTAALKHLGLKKTGMSYGIVYGLVLFLAISTMYYMKHCDQVGEFKPGGGGIGQYLAGQVHYNTEEPEPHVLTNPKGYPGLELKNIEEPFLREWVKKHCPDVK